MSNSDLKYNYALDEYKNIISITEAKKGNVYFFGNTDIELIVRDGSKNVKHYSLKSGGDINSIGGGGEGENHYNQKWLIKKQGFFYWETFKIIPKRIEVEYYIKEIKKQPDIVFFDDKDNMMCIIEIHDTNPKTEEDINKFQKLNIPVYEYNINNGETELLCPRMASEQSIKRVRENLDKFDRDFLCDVERNTKEYRYEEKHLDRRIYEYNKIERITGETEEKTRGIEFDIRKSSKTIKGISDDIEGCKYAVRRKENRIDSVGGEISYIEEKIKEVNKSTEESDKIEKRIIEANKTIQGVKGNIRWQVNRERQFKTIIKRGW